MKGTPALLPGVPGPPSPGLLLLPVELLPLSFPPPPPSPNVLSGGLPGPGGPGGSFLLSLLSEVSDLSSKTLGYLLIYYDVL